MMERNDSLDLPEHMVRSEEEYTYRQKLIDAIEALAGSLQSIPYHLISTEDLKKLCDAVESTWR